MCKFLRLKRTRSCAARPISAQSFHDPTCCCTLMAPIEVPRMPIGKHPASSRTSRQQINVFIVPSSLPGAPARRESWVSSPARGAPACVWRPSLALDSKFLSLTGASRGRLRLFVVGNELGKTPDRLVADATSANYAAACLVSKSMRSEVLPPFRRRGEPHWPSHGPFHLARDHYRCNVPGKHLGFSNFLVGQTL
jgi:hypothetical protein